MRLRSYLKGLGLGIFITTLIISLSMKNAKGEISDEEIRKRAAELGMVSENSMLLTEAKAMADTAQAKAKAQMTVSEDTGKAMTDSTVSSSSVSDNGEIIYPESKKPVSPKEDSAATAGSTTDAPELPGDKTPEPEPQDTSSAEQSENPPEGSDEIVTITVNAGESSISVATKMARAGLISDAGQFDSYLVLSGYDRKLVIGSHPIPKGSTPAEMGAILTSKQ
ncbi:MAG: hypothetical protein IJT24_06055 [Lachnospiraceae bacterium]|nr:hypothetical protein [Lachnospiraceae bacterium]